MSRKYDKACRKASETGRTAAPHAFMLEFDLFQILRNRTIIKVREAKDLFGQSESCLEGCGASCNKHNKYPAPAKFYLQSDKHNSVGAEPF